MAAISKSNARSSATLRRHSNNTRNYLYTGRLREFTARWPAAEGSKICAELWYHEGSGRYSSWGLPCDNM